MTDYEHARTDAAVFDLSHHGRIELTGPDAFSFLHNLCSNDVLHLAAGTGCEAFLLNVKARVVAYVYLDHLARPAGTPGLWLDVGPVPAEPVLKHLDRFLISEQVEMADRSADFAQLHVAGPRAREVLSRALE